MENWFVDTANAQLLRQLVAERLKRDADCPGVTHDWDERGEFYRFRIGERLYVLVKVFITADNTIGDCVFSVINGPDAPAYHVTIKDDLVLARGVEENQYERALKTIGIRMARGYIGSKLHMPYGYVEDGTVIAIWYSGLFVGNVPGSLCTNVADFALKGHDLPEALLGRNQDEPGAYTARYWQCVHSGQIIELGQRVQAHPGELFFVSSGVEWPHVIFTDADEQTPHIPAHVPYFLRLASDPPGNDLPRTRQLVADHLSANEAPVNLGEFFTMRMHEGY